MPTLLQAVQSSHVQVHDLSNMERAVALYASDMPTSYRYRKGDQEKHCDWITQGATRLGLENLAYLAAMHRVHRLNWLNGITPEERSVAGFADESRRDRAGRLAALVTGHVPVSDQALWRQGQSAESLRPASLEVAA
ncbi:hypothetical protein ACIGFK_07655 [Streptomyces sp. NPDC085524]|uniref:hypothetical protein n=1 Tax=Streptomyces sp. NPDC085524 TaxID=3365728 RepID=UPI0037D79A98